MDGVWGINQAGVWSSGCAQTFRPASWASSRAFTRVTSFCLPPASMPETTAGARKLPASFRGVPGVQSQQRAVRSARAHPYPVPHPISQPPPDLFSFFHPRGVPSGRRAHPARLT